MYVIAERNFWEAVKNGANPEQIIELFDYVLDEDGYLIDSRYFLLIPEKRDKLARLRPDLLLKGETK